MAEASRYTSAASRAAKAPRKSLSSARKTAASPRGVAASNRQPTVRLSADLPQKDADTLEDVARATGFNKVTTLVRAIRVLAELVRAEEADGELTIKYPDGRRERLIIR
jgi:hypothetical protein